MTAMIIAHILLLKFLILFPPGDRFVASEEIIQRYVPRGQVTWVAKRTIFPADISLMKFRTRILSFGSRPAVGSSMIRISGPFNSACAISVPGGHLSHQALHTAAYRFSVYLRLPEGSTGISSTKTGVIVAVSPKYGRIRPRISSTSIFSGSPFSSSVYVVFVS